MNYTEDVTVELASDGMTVHSPTSADVETEYYVIRDANLFTDDRNRSLRPVVALVVAVIYLIVQVFGS